MARESEQRQKNELYDREMDRIRNERLKMQQDYERNANDRESAYAKLHEENMKKMVEQWSKKLHDERERWSRFRTLKFQKAMEGEEALLLT